MTIKMPRRICMSFRKLFAILVTVIAVSGFLGAGSARALDFADWAFPIWFKVKVSETGKAGPVVDPLAPQGGKVVTNNEKQSNAYLAVLQYVEPNFEVGYCTFDGTVWTTQVGLTWPVLGGEPTKFITLFNFTRQQSQNIAEEFWIPLEVKGTEAANTVGEISSASFKNHGGIFLENVGTPVVTQRGVGSVKFTGNLVKGTEKVEKDVPEGCRLTIPQ
jgi:hypothetical protein